jgi:hypothetical protein
MEQARLRHPEQRGDADRPGRLAEDRDVAGIAKAAMHRAPLERGDLIEDTLVAGGGEPVAQRLQVEEAEDAEAVVDRDDHDVAAARNGTVVDRLRPAPMTNAPPWIRPSPVAAVGRGRPHVEEETALAHRLDLEAEHRTERVDVLRRGRTERAGVAHTGPRLGRLGRAEAQIAGGRRCERQPAEDADAVLHRDLPPD